MSLFNYNYPIIRREQKEKTDLGLFPIEYLNTMDMTIWLIPYGTNKMEYLVDIPIKIIGDEDDYDYYYSLTLYRRRNNTFYIKAKKTEIERVDILFKSIT